MFPKRMRITENKKNESFSFRLENIFEEMAADSWEK